MDLSICRSMLLLRTAIIHSWYFYTDALGARSWIKRSQSSFDPAHGFRDNQFYSTQVLAGPGQPGYETANLLAADTGVCSSSRSQEKM